MSNLLRLLGALVFLAFSALLLLSSAGTFSQLFADYKDSKDSTYVIAGLIFLLLGLIFLARFRSES